MKFNNVEYAGQHNTGLTFTIETGEKGQAMAQTGPGTAGLGADGAALLGRLETKEADMKGTVFTRGVIVVPWVGAETFGRQNVVVDGTGKAKVGAAGRSVQVLGVSGGYAALDLG
ncbi:hypothetical protein WDJ50_18635 (plasmid) [Deinococcus sp. VB142]|uniref:DUF2190 domain-containing protein n=1 Tax=Deinococcus sp. VB142 TaxID=3112952 RepID=A0AAU6Q8X2_9DEIO